MKLTITQVKKAAIALITLPVLGMLLLGSASVRTRAANEEVDAAAIYAANKCAICHGAKAEKKFDAAAPEAEMVEAILKGKKGEKPPFMPGYEAKGINEEQAKALVAYMKQLKGN